MNPDLQAAVRAYATALAGPLLDRPETLEVYVSETEVAISAPRSGALIGAAGANAAAIRRLVVAFVRCRQYRGAVSVRVG